MKRPVEEWEKLFDLAFSIYEVEKDMLENAVASAIIKMKKAGL